MEIYICIIGYVTKVGRGQMGFLFVEQIYKSEGWF